MNVVGIMHYRMNGKRFRYELEIRNDAILKYKIITGDDKYVVQQKAAVELAKWEDAERKHIEREKAIRERDTKRRAASDLARDKDEKRSLAESRTEEALKAREELEKILLATLDVNDQVDWESLKDQSTFTIARPSLGKEPPKPQLAQYPPKPDPQDFTPALSIFDKLFSSRKQRKLEDANRKYLAAGKNWETTCKRIHADNERLEIEFKEAVLKHRRLHEKQAEEWEALKNDHEQRKFACNSAIDSKKAAYESADPEAVLDYCDIVLSRSQYPDCFPQGFELELNAENRILIIEYQLPRPSDLPTLKEVKYQPTKDAFAEKHFSASQNQDLYDSVIYQTALRTIHEVFEADTVDFIKAIAFNGRVQGIDAATGQEVNPCVLSLQVLKDEFMQINLGRVEPKVCFKKLKGVASSQLHSLTPVAPVLQIERADTRFVSSYSVVSDLDDSHNLAAMDWEDFEHLIRELFEQEFAHAGGEVKVTRASRDGGVDAVIFDPDPIRGGKIVIQAKRYTNTVGVSAVRDLFGTVVNEGANKGILVSTSDYGPDAYEFSRGKPLVLLNGNNLLHLLEKHGHRAKIDIQDARRIMQLNQRQ